MAIVFYARQPFKCLPFSQFFLVKVNIVLLINANNISINVKSIEKLSIFNFRIISNTKLAEYFAWKIKKRLYELQVTCYQMAALQQTRSLKTKISRVNKCNLLLLKVSLHKRKFNLLIKNQKYTLFPGNKKFLVSLLRQKRW